MSVEAAHTNLLLISIFIYLVNFFGLRLSKSTEFGYPWTSHDCSAVLCIYRYNVTNAQWTSLIKIKHLFVNDINIKYFFFF